MENTEEKVAPIEKIWMIFKENSYEIFRFYYLSTYNNSWESICLENFVDGYNVLLTYLSRKELFNKKLYTFRPLDRIAAQKVYSIYNSLKK